MRDKYMKVYQLHAMSEESLRLSGSGKEAVAMMSIEVNTEENAMNEETHEEEVMEQHVDDVSAVNRLFEEEENASGTNETESQMNEDGRNDTSEKTVPKVQLLYTCLKCGKKFAKKHYAKVHCRGSPWKCENCRTVIKQGCNVKRHKERCVKKQMQKAVIKQVKVFSCDECGQQFANCFNLARHGRVQHGFVTDGQIKCPVNECSFSTNSRQQMTRHSTMAHSSMDVKCAVCEFMCYSDSGLRKHMFTIHGLECEKCGMLFSSEDKLNAHSEKHTEELSNDKSSQVVVTRRIGEHASHLVIANDDDETN